MPQEGYQPTPEDLAIFAATVLENRWIPVEPTERQAIFLMCPALEVFYGGAAGGGKSAALLMAALQYVDTPGYSALILRRTFTDLSLPGALIDLAHEWLDGTEAHWDGRKHVWTFPSGATLTFGYLMTEGQRTRYRSAQFQTICFDELTQFSEVTYRYMFSRLRRPQGLNVPLRMRSASNPGDVGHGWVKQRFLIEGKKHGRVFIPARLSDNPHIDAESYLQSLNRLDPVTRRQLLEGDWDAVEGILFRPEWFPIVDDWPREGQAVRYWDLAATRPRPGRDPDWTAGVLLATKQGRFWVLDVRRTRATPAGVEDLVRQTAELDGPGIPIYIEQEPGASGVMTIDHFQRLVLPGFIVRPSRPARDKVTRARPLSAAAEAGNVLLVRASWNGDLLSQLSEFPGGRHDDLVDALSGAHGILSSLERSRVGVAPILVSNYPAMAVGRTSTPGAPLPLWRLPSEPRWRW